MSRVSHPPLSPAFDHQDKVFEAAFSVIEKAIGDHAFPCASIAVTHAGKLVASRSFGCLVYAEDAKVNSALALPKSRSLQQGGDFEATSATLFDIASVTKVVASTTMAMILYERGLLELDALIAGVIPEFLAAREPDSRRREVTFRMLLAHSSGLPAYEKLFLRTNSRDDLLQAALTTPLTADPGTRAEYSDIAFIILGVALERLAEESLDSFCRREIFGPLAMVNTTFNPPTEMRSEIPPTADERDQSHADARARAKQAQDSERGVSSSAPRSTFRNRVIQGEVQDENASVLGGVAGHAGVFSTADDLASFAHALLDGGSPILRPETIALFTRRQTSPAGTSRALGWDTPSSPSQSGTQFGPRSYGHLGYTGTSLWIDPDRQLSIALLTNRTWPDCTNQAIKQVRPAFHDAIVKDAIIGGLF